MAVALEGRSSTVLKVRMLANRLGHNIVTMSGYGSLKAEDPGMFKLGEPHDN